MKHSLYTVYDKSARTWAAPYMSPNDVSAIRAFRMEVNRAHDQNVVYTHPNDFALYRCGTFTTDTGRLETIDDGHAELVIEASALINDVRATIKEATR